MKLSEAIELALTSGEYTAQLSFMCWALERMGQSEHVPAVMVLVHSFNPTCSSMSGAIDCSVMNWENVNPDMDELTKELYVWWVFDLKRKGL